VLDVAAFARVDVFGRIRSRILGGRNALGRK